MKRELGIARCGLACCLCGEAAHCAGCDSGDCPDKDRCENRACSLERGVAHCFDCPQEDCKKGMLQKSKPYGFTAFARRYGEQARFTHPSLSGQSPESHPAQCSLSPHRQQASPHRAMPSSRFMATSPYLPKGRLKEPISTRFPSGSAT